MSRDTALLAECRALVLALESFPSLAALRAAASGPALEARLAQVLGRVRAHPATTPPDPSPLPGRLRVVHWNTEHGNRFDEIAAALLHHAVLAGADLHLLTEVDLGMARSGNRDVAAELADSLGRHAVWAPLFLETTVGRHDDALTAVAAANQEALFGLAMLARWPISDARIVELPSPERFQFDVERMYGRHIALVATVERPGAPFTAVVTHLEVHRTRRHRAEQIRALLEGLGDTGLPVVLGGDFNTHTFDRGRPWSVLDGARVLALTPDRALERRLRHPDQVPAREPLFDLLRAAGFEWDRFVDRTPTLALRFARVDEAGGFLRAAGGPLRALLARAERRARLRLDWIAARGFGGGSGRTLPELGGPGRASDHAPIVAELFPASPLAS